MKKIFLILLSLILLSGCSASPQEKRNNYDACLIEKETVWKQQMRDQYPDWNETNIQKSADQQDFPSRCVDFLK